MHQEVCQSLDTAVISGKRLSRRYLPHTSSEIRPQHHYVCCVPALLKVYVTLHMYMYMYNMYMYMYMYRADARERENEVHAQQRFSCRSLLVSRFDAFRPSARKVAAAVWRKRAPSKAPRRVERNVRRYTAEARRHKLEDEAGHVRRELGDERVARRQAIQVF